MLTGADGSMTPVESAATPPGKLLGVAVAMGARLVPIGAMRRVAGCGPGPAFHAWQGHTMCENPPFSGLPTVIVFGVEWTRGTCFGGRVQRSGVTSKLVKGNSVTV